MKNWDEIAVSKGVSGGHWPATTSTNNFEVSQYSQIVCSLWDIASSIPNPRPHSLAAVDVDP